MKLTDIKKPILVTGASGFIGSQLVNRLIDKKIEVHLLLRKSSKLDKLNINKLKFIKVKRINFENLKKIDNYIKKVRPKTIFHLASSGNNEKLNRRELTLINYNFLKNFYLICLKYNFYIFINTGSVSEYGTSKKVTKFKENKMFDKISYYGKSKLQGTNFVSELARLKKKNTVTIRPFYVYGPNENNNRLISSLISAMKSNNLISLPKNTETFRDFIYIDDVIDFYLVIAKSKKKYFGEIFNIGTGKKTKIINIFKILKKIYKYKLNPTHNYTKKEEANYSSVASMIKSRREFKFNSKINLTHGIKKTLDWFLNQTF